MAGARRVWKLGAGDDITEIDHGQPVRIAVLDSLRGILALVVVVHHCLLTQPAFSDFFFSTWKTPAHTVAQYLLFFTPARIVWSGFEAVTTFYVLSGLVLALPWVEQRPPNYIAFSIKRIARIYLPYCAAIILAATLNTTLLPWANVSGASRWVTEMTWTIPVTQGTLLDHAVMYGHHNNVNGVVHSLIWEMRVSLLFPFLILPIARFRARGAMAVIAGLVALTLFLQFAFSGGFNAGYDLLSPYGQTGLLAKFAYELQWTAYYACFFIGGALLALYLKPLRRWLAAITPTARFGILLSGLLIFQHHWTRIHALQGLMVAAGSIVIIIAALSPGIIERTLLQRPLRFLGRISYSLYLVHVPLILTMIILLQAVPITTLLIVIPPTSILLGWLFHISIADPAARWGQHIARNYRPNALNPLNSPRLSPIIRRGNQR